MGSPSCGVRVGTVHAEAVRSALQDAGVIRVDLVPDRLADEVVFPVQATEAEARGALGRVGEDAGFTFVDEHEFAERSPRARNYRERLADLPEGLREDLPKAFDVVGDVAVLKVPDSLTPYRARIGEAILATKPSLRTVAHDDGVDGPYRVRKLTVLAGRPDLTTVYKEHGITIEVPLDKAYFSPRLATERMRVASRVAPGQRVLDMFAGVGAFVCLVGRTRTPASITAIDLNPAAVAALRANAARNLADLPVEVLEGDARVVTPATASFDHVVMNLPHGAHEFLDVAHRAARDDGEVHLYAMLERDDVDGFVTACRAALDEHAERSGRPAGWRLLDTRHVRNYGPTMDGLGFTFAGPSHG